MSWIIRNNGDRIGHFLGGYGSIYGGPVGEKGDEIRIRSPPIRDHVTYPTFPHNAFDLWSIKPTVYRGRYHSIFNEYGKDSRHNDSRGLIVVQESLDNNDNHIRQILREAGLMLKPIDSYVDYRKFLEDAIIMLDDILITYDDLSGSVADELKKAGFDVHAHNRS